MSVDNILPLPIPVSTDALSKDIAYFKLYKAGGLSNNIVLTSDVTINPILYAFLPETLIQGVNLSEYIFKSKLNNISQSDTVNFKINKSGNFKYDINIYAFSNVNGIISMDLINEFNVGYSSKLLTVDNISPSTRVISLMGVLDHAANDIVKIRIGGTTTTSAQITINISRIEIVITSV
jgi:hypothetical protein